MSISLKIAVCSMAIVLLSAGCKKNTEDSPEPTISINIKSPLEGAVIAEGDSVVMVADISSPVDLHGYTWTIREKASGSILKEVSDHSHEREFTISGNFINTLDSTVEAELEVKAEVDHEGHESSKKVNITLQH